MVATQQQGERYYRDLVFIDDGIEWILKACSKLAEMVLLIGIGYAGYKMTQHGNTNANIDAIWIVSQILALDLSAPGLLAMAKDAQENGETERAKWAKKIAGIMIVLSILSMVEGAAQYYFHNINGTAIDIASFSMMIARCGAAVGYSVFCRLHKSQRRTQLTMVATLQSQIDAQLYEMEHMRQQHTQELQSTIVRMEQESQKKIQSAILQIEVSSQKKIEGAKPRRELTTIESEPLVNPEKVQSTKGVHASPEPPDELPVELSVDEIRELPQVNMRDVVFVYLSEQRELDCVPSNAEIMIACNCSKNTAIKYKREFAESEVS